MVEYVSAKGKKLCCVKSSMGFAERWSTGQYFQSREIISVTHDILADVIINVRSNLTASAISVNLIVAIQDLSTGEWYYRT